MSREQFSNLSLVISGVDALAIAIAYQANAKASTSHR
jgi:hypothetical protein